VLYLSPRGRGAVVTHALYSPSELERVRRDVGVSAVEAPPAPRTASPTPQPTMAVAAAVVPAPPAPPAVVPPAPASNDLASRIEAQIADVRAELSAEIATLRAELRALREALGA
jgi:hypothetical protein